MLLDQLRQDLTAALKSGEKDKLSTMRLLVSALSYEKIAKQHELSDDEVMAVLKKEAKKRQEAIDIYRTAGRTDLAEKEEKELVLIRTYFPPEMTEAKIRERVLFLVNNLSVDERANFGQVMQSVMTQLKGKADGGLVVKVVREILK